MVYISVFAVTATNGSALMYGLASTVYPLSNTATRLHLCIRPIEEARLRLLANIG